VLNLHRNMKFWVFLCLLMLSLAIEEVEQLRHYSFENFLLDFNLDYSSEFNFRKQLFESRVEAFIRHNQDSTKSWKLGVNRYAAWTNEELKSLRGGKFANKKSKHLIRTPWKEDLKSINVKQSIDIDWRKSGVVTPVKDQGQCGSCWTFGAAETLESFWALATGKFVVLSEQQILDCTPNPNDCGGTGGCGGGTVEIAWSKIIEIGGLASEKDYPYISGGGDNYQCQSKLPTPAAKLTSYVNLPSNQLKPVLDALQNRGPLAINVDAASWSFYSSGVFDGCDQVNPDIDHVVQLVGAGTDPVYGDFWLVRNSWNAGWGENGYIRLRRTAVPRCGIDHSPQDGDGCNGGPKEVTVCGTCGILFDVLYPIVPVNISI